MKRILFFLFLGISSLASAQHTATVEKAFEKNQSKSEVTLSIILDSALAESEMNSVQQWASDNESILKLSVVDKRVVLTTSIEKLERSYVLKPFYMMNIVDVIVGSKKLTIEEFLTANNL
jgi:hypothetical protein